jgi:hypothetical protein
MKSEPAALELIGRYLDGQATAEDTARLEALMMHDAQLRAEFLACARVDAALRSAVGGNQNLASLPPVRKAWRPLRVALWGSLAASVALLIGMTAMFLQLEGRAPSANAVARFGQLDGCRWMDPATRVLNGDAIAAGQRVELSAGRAEVHFATGARVTVLGPAIFELRSENGGFLTLGELRVAAETEGAKGFTLETPASKFVDIGTTFRAGVSVDGLSRLDVTEGIVDVLLGGPDTARRLRAGQTMYVEPGEKRIITRIEAGDGTAAFRFPTIPPPSRDDYADRSLRHASIRVTRGTLGAEAGRPGGSADVLLDGAGQSQQDSPRESAFFHHENTGTFLLDLGSEVSIRTVRSYSWHQNATIPEHRERARQRFTLYGYADDAPPDVTSAPEQAGWTRIARVNTDESLHVQQRLDRPAQQACAISAEHGDIGRFRYLLWEVRGGTFYGELDVEAGP